MRVYQDKHGCGHISMYSESNSSDVLQRNDDFMHGSHRCCCNCLQQACITCLELKRFSSVHRHHHPPSCLFSFAFSTSSFSFSSLSSLSFFSLSLPPGSPSHHPFSGSISVFSFTCVACVALASWCLLLVDGGGVGVAVKGALPKIPDCMTFKKHR